LIEPRKGSIMKCKLSIAISILFFALLVGASNGQAQTAQQAPGPINKQQNPSKPPQEYKFVKPSLVGTISFATPTDPKISAFSCSDFTVVVGVDAKTDGDKHGGVSVPYLQTVASAKAITKGKGQCSYIVSSMPVVKPFKVELRVTDQKKFSCDRVELTSSYWPVKTLETITFKSDQIEERNFQVRGIKCAIVK
jgi:hypothetical protein